MTTILRVIVDQLAAPVPGPLGRYTLGLAAGLIATRPAGCEVEGIVSASPAADYRMLEQALPGLASLYKTTLPRRELAAAWQLGLTTSPGPGMIHAPGLLAPLRRHDPTAGTQLVVTAHDTIAFTHPESLSSAELALRKNVLRRARKYADAVVVPTHALAERLAETGDFGDRIRVIATAARPGLALGPDAAARAARLALPRDFVVAAGTLEPHRGVVDVLAALGRPGAPAVPLLVLGPETWGEQHLQTLAEEAGMRRGMVRSMAEVDAADLAVILSRASAFIAPAHDEGDPATIIEAFACGTPVIHSDTPDYRETAGGAGLSVPVGDAGDDYADRIAQALSAVLGDQRLAERLSIGGADRSRAFGWINAAEQVWQLHADL
ncbi:glycosyltransferase [Agromyces archimandritae]|uniref:Glycosyltransferase n=1 Tax=Agromyces archimandritae TaxID=2781962 RepID=A0A975FNN9_9MICO|nr:glycosyltransferase [Agromyces archimandritae]QTX05291.1 glycosyltransferase [Agromyces archimandritae]